MAAPATYSIDSSALIHGWRRVYRPRNFRIVWERLAALAEEGRLRASIEVFNELQKKRTSCSRGAKNGRTHCSSKSRMRFKPISLGLWRSTRDSSIRSKAGPVQTHL